LVLCANVFFSCSHPNTELQYSENFGLILKTKADIIKVEGKPDSVYTIPYQGIIMSYEKDKVTSTGIKYKRNVAYYFEYDGKPNSTTLVDTCYEIEIDEPLVNKDGWVDYFNKKYTQEKIDSDGTDRNGSLGCEKEWDYSNRISICMTKQGQMLEIQMNVRKQ